MELYRPSKLAINFLKQCGEEVRFNGERALYFDPITPIPIWIGTNIRNENAEVSEEEFIDGHHNRMQF